MSHALFTPPDPINEPVRGYAPGSPERASLQARLAELCAAEVEIPLLIGGREVRTGQLEEIRCPGRRGLVLGRYHRASREHVEAAIQASLAARREWLGTPWEERAAILLRAAELLAGEWRDTLNGVTMLGQGKTVQQAEIDAACEQIDFFRFNVAFMHQIYQDQPISGPGVWNRMDYRPLEGFVFAVTPFNFTAIAGNLVTAPALMGNTVVWKPASSAVYSGWQVARLLQRAGMPPGVINFVPGSGAEVGDPALASPDLAGVHFTGSVEVWNRIWRQVGEGIGGYRTYPRLVGETGGKDFVVAHPSADPQALVVALLRGAFEYQGQKCSAASRAYVAESVWARMGEALLEEVGRIRTGHVADFTNFCGPVIDAAAFARIRGYLDHARSAPGLEILAGGGADDAEGFFIEPTVVRVHDPADRILREEIFGPVLAVVVYPDDRFEEILEVCDGTSPFGLTGSIFAEDRRAVQAAADRLRFAAGNFYINDKPTGAVVGQQPFGGARASGTNDKAGSPLNLLRWVSVRTLKETFCPPRDWRYPSHQPDPA